MNLSPSSPSDLRVKGTPSACACPAKRGFEVSDWFGVFSPQIPQFAPSQHTLNGGSTNVLYRLTTTLGTTYIVEPIEYVDGLRDRCLSARFLDSRGYWDEGDFEVGQIVSLEPQLELAA